jgi:hypothetical protein
MLDPIAIRGYDRCPCSGASFVVSLKLKEKMCPVCVTTMALMVASATSSGGLTLFAAKKINSKNGKKIIAQPSSKNNLL